MPTRPLAPLADWVPVALLAALSEVGSEHRIHLVGGALRDRWLGREAPDLDLVADGRAEDLGRRLARRLGGRFVSLAGERFAAYRIVAGSLVVDLWGRGTASIEADLARRDLTINSLAVDLDGEQLFDPFGGIADLERGILRATTERGFAEDPLRVLRLARFAAELDGFAADEQTLGLARLAATHVESVAVERVREEVDKLLTCAGAARGLTILVACGLYPRLWGGPESAAADATAPRVSAVEAIRDLDQVDRELCERDCTVLAHAALFCAPGGGAVEASTSALLNRRQRQRVTRLLELDSLPTSDEAARWFLRQWGRRWCEAVSFAILRDLEEAAPDSGDAASRLAELARDRGRQLFDLPALVDGDEVGRLLGIPPGPTIGRALEALEREQVAGRVTSRAEALEFLAARFGR